MTNIPWADETWNPITGCTPISEGCQNCYAARMAKRLAGRFGYPDAPNQFDVTFHPDKLDTPLRWKKTRKTFVCSMGDLFHDEVFDLKSPFSVGQNYLLGSFITYTEHPMLDAIFAVMERVFMYPQIFMLLTKRPGNMKRYFDAVQVHKNEYADKFKDCPTEAMQNSPAAKDARHSAENPIPSNIWLGVTAENQKRYDERWTIASQIPAAVKFVSIEPMLGPVDLLGQEHIGRIHSKHEVERLDWIIAGPETGPGARECKPEWIEDLYEQCKAAGVSFFDKRKDFLAREFPK